MKIESSAPEPISAVTATRTPALNSLLFLSRALSGGAGKPTKAPFFGSCLDKQAYSRVER